MLHRRWSRAHRWLGIFVVFGLLAVGAPAQQAPPPAADPSALTPEVKQAVLARIAEIVEKQAYVPGADFTRWPTVMELQKPAIDKAQNPRDFVVAVNAAFRKFGVTHLVIATPQQAQARRERKAIGIGVSLQAETGGLRVVNLFPGAPAEKAGIELGDLILEADGKKAENSGSIAGDEGTQVVLKVLKQDAKIKTYTIVRAKFSSVRPETLTWVDKAKESAVLRIPTFDISYDRKSIEGLMTEAATAKNLILDLRSNGGGAVNNFVNLLGYFLPEGTPVGTFVSRAMVERFVKETKDKPDNTLKIAHWSDRKVKAGKVNISVFKGHVAVLVNGGTGSASEIVAAALQENLEAAIVGSKSAGAVLVSMMVPLPNGYQLQFPISDYVTMHGTRLEGAGVQPDAEAPVARYGQTDIAIDKAIALLHRMDLRDTRYGKIGG